MLTHTLEKLHECSEMPQEIFTNVQSTASHADPHWREAT